MCLEAETLEGWMDETSVVTFVGCAAPRAALALLARAAALTSSLLGDMSPETSLLIKTARDTAQGVSMDGYWTIKELELPRGNDAPKPNDFHAVYPVALDALLKSVEIILTLIDAAHRTEDGKPGDAEAKLQIFKKAFDMSHSAFLEVVHDGSVWLRHGGEGAKQAVLAILADDELKLDSISTGEQYGWLGLPADVGRTGPFLPLPPIAATHHRALGGSEEAEEPSDEEYEVVCKVAGANPDPEELLNFVESAKLVKGEPIPVIYAPGIAELETNVEEEGDGSVSLFGRLVDAGATVILDATVGAVVPKSDADLARALGVPPNPDVLEAVMTRPKRAARKPPQQRASAVGLADSASIVAPDDGQPWPGVEDESIYEEFFKRCTQGDTAAVPRAS